MKTARTIGEDIVDGTAQLEVPLRVVLLPNPTESLLVCQAVELDNLGVVDPTRTSEVSVSIDVVGGTTIWSGEGADVICDAQCDAVVGFVVGLIAVFHLLVALGQACLGALVALWETHLVHM